MAVLDDEFVRSTGYRGYPGIYHNGAVVYDHNGVVLRMCKFSEVFISEFCQYVISRELQRSVVFCDMEDTYMLCDDSSQMTNILADVDVYTLPTLVDTADLARKNITLIIVGNGEIMTKQAHLQCNVDYVMKEGSFGAWDVTPCTVTKAEGLNVLLANYNATGSDCGFIGNGTNDIEAMRLCHISFAVGNAEPGVKEHAKYTLHETNNSGAFHKTMELVYGVPCD
ncbi:haloacid dehalogenase-like hydrolase family member protein [Babesia caballi]|nr:haloacid dehalogenase-like hydrolase family member protein [Babesia caballi]